MDSTLEICSLSTGVTCPCPSGCRGSVGDTIPLHWDYRGGLSDVQLEICSLSTGTTGARKRRRSSAVGDMFPLHWDYRRLIVVMLELSWRYVPSPLGLQAADRRNAGTQLEICSLSTGTTGTSRRCSPSPVGGQLEICSLSTGTIGLPKCSSQQLEI